MSELSLLERIIARILVNSAIHRQGCFTYSELCDLLERKYGQKVNPHYGLSTPLGNVARLCNELELPLLTVRVQYKNDGGTKTAAGFYDIACKLKPDYRNMDPKHVRTKELQLTRECSDWSRLIEYLEGSNPTHKKVEQHVLTVSDQLEQYTQTIIKQYGLGHYVKHQEIVNSLVAKYGTNPSSIIPADFCYNRWNKGIPEDGISYFEYVSRGEYRIWGKNYSFNGIILANPINGNEHCVGYCIDGRRYIGKWPVYPDELADDSLEYREGKKLMVTINTYERNPAARAACIKHYGTKCFICRFDFGQFYGSDCEGLIHVHHLNMISKAEGEYEVDPIRDLRPVCPNCHMVLHSKDNGYTVEEVIEMVNQNYTNQLG